jgi:hypothetical protein
MSGDYRVTTSITLKELKSKRNRRWRMVGDGFGAQMTAGDRR